jgi:RNA polymerase sigma-70 factor, ECF subfamily
MFSTGTVNPTPGSFDTEHPPTATGGGADDERILLDGMLNDDPAAWREFNVRYARLIYRCITRVTSRFSSIVGPDDVREIYAMLCMSLLANDKRKLRSFEPGRGNKLGSWIGMLAIHAAYDFLRGLKREPMRASLGEAEMMSSELPDPFESYLMRQRAEIVSLLLSRFSDKDREFVTLYFGEGLQPEQVAARMGISVKTVYSKKHKIRNRLEALLLERKLAA